MPSRLEQILSIYRARVLRRDAATLAALTRRWRDVERSLETEIALLAEELAGQSLTAAQLMQQARLVSLLQQAKFVAARYENFAAETISAQQREYYALGEEFAREAARVRMPRGSVSALWNRLPVTAVSEMIGLAGDGSPLFDVLQRRALADSMIDGLIRALVQGMAQGWNPRKTARMMQDGLTAGLQKALVIARTEQLRAYRQGTVLSYQHNRDLVTAMQWVSACDLRTCPACWALHGQIFPLERVINDHPCGRCTYVPIMVEDDGYEMENGEARLRRLKPEAQQSILGAERYRLWQDGTPLRDFARIEDDPTWGQTATLVKLTDLKH